MTEATESSPVSDTQPSVGERLMQARQSQGLSLGEMARQLKLSVKQVDALERDDYRSFPGPLWVRGFLRNYAKVLGLDAAALVQKAGLTPESTGEDLPPSAVPTTPAAVGKERRRVVVLVLVFVVLGLFVLALLGQRAGHHRNDATPGVAPGAAPPATSSSPTAVPAPVPDAPIPGAATEVGPATGPTPAAGSDAQSVAPTTPPADTTSGQVRGQPELAPAGSPGPAVPAPGNTPSPPPATPAGGTSQLTPSVPAPSVPVPSAASLAPTTPAGNAPAPGAGTAAPKPEVGKPQGAAAANTAAKPAPPSPTPAAGATTATAATPQAAPVETASATAASAPAPTGNAAPPSPAEPVKPRTIRLTFTQSVDMRVVDAEGKVLLTALQAAGTEKAVRGVPPFSLSVGNVHAVRIVYRGRDVNLTAHGRTGSARVTLK